jgi:hypothetical protein
MEHIDKVEYALRLLTDLHELLEKQNTKNWVGGIRTAIAELEDDGVDREGFENARRAYRAMTNGGRGLAEYNIWSPNYTERIKLNERLDEIRRELEKVFDD